MSFQTLPLLGENKPHLVLVDIDSGMEFDLAVATLDGTTYEWSTGPDWSGATTVDLQLLSKLPAKPTGLSVTPEAPAGHGDSGFILTWVAPTKNGASTITGYKVEVSEDGTDDSWTELEDDTESADPSFTVTGLPGGTTRHYRVSAINASGAGDPSDPESNTTNATVPGPPADIWAQGTSPTTIALAWTPPEANGGAAITGYRIEVSSDGGSVWTDLETDTASPDTTYVHTGLSQGDMRHYRVSAINTEGTGNPSGFTSARTPAVTVPFPVAGNVIWSGNLTVGDAGMGLRGFLGNKGDLDDKTFSFRGTTTRLRGYTLPQR